MIARHQHLRYRPPLPHLRPGVMRVFEQPVGETLLRQCLGAADHPGQQPHAGINSNFTLRKISYGEGVERVFPLHSPRITAIEVVRRGDVRRAKLYYLRGLRGKKARIAERGREDTRRERAAVPATGTAETAETEA